MASSRRSPLSFHVLLRYSHAELIWWGEKRHKYFTLSQKTDPHMKTEQGVLVKMALYAMYYLINTFLYHRFVRFSTGSHELCALVLNNFEFLLQPINLLLKTLEE